MDNNGAYLGWSLFQARN